MTTIDHPQLTLGRWFREARERAGFTQLRAAEAIGVSRPLVTQWEKDEGKRPSLDHLGTMVRVYDAPWLWNVAADWYAASDSNREPTDSGLYQPNLFEPLPGEVVMLRLPDDLDLALAR